MVCKEAEQCFRCSLLGLAPGQRQTHLNTPYSFPTTDANTFQDISAAQRDQLFADFAAAAFL